MAALMAALTIACASSAARANGRFPASNAFFFSPTDPDLVLLRVTFGLLVSHDRGRTWDFVCEQSLGLAGVEDPMYAVTPNNSFVTSTFQGLTVSHDQGCSFSRVAGALAGQVFIDVASRPTDRSNVVVFASSYGASQNDGGVTFRSQLFETKDEGSSFSPLGPPIDATLLGQTVDLTATDPLRLYVSAGRNPGRPGAQGVLLTSKDFGSTWEEHVIPFVEAESSVFIAAVDPTNAERVFLRTNGPPDRAGRLLVTDDGGATIREVFKSQAPLAGFALSRDGQKIWVGSLRDGLWVADAREMRFTKRSDQEIECLAVSDEGLWACSSEKGGFVAGLSRDEGATFEPRLRFCEMRNQLACPASAGTPRACSAPRPETGDQVPFRYVKELLGCVAPEARDAGDAGGPAPPGAPNDEGSSCAAVRPSGTGSATALAAMVAIVTLVSVRRGRGRRRAGRGGGH